MNRCKNEQCNNDCKGSSAYCSDSCRTIYNRNKRNTATGTPTGTNTIETGVIAKRATSDTNQTDIDSICMTYAERANPDTLNTGDHMTAHQLKQAGLKANRVPIPGDHDYSGVCEQVGGVWQVRAA